MANRILNSIKRNNASSQHSYFFQHSYSLKKGRGASDNSEHINEALITFFEMRGSEHPEQDASETINRVTRRFGQGRNVYDDLPASYFYSEARSQLQKKTGKK